MKTKTFDCVRMKQQGAEKVREATAGMTPQQQMDYWRRQTDSLRRRQRELQQHRK